MIPVAWAERREPGWTQMETASTHPDRVQSAVCGRTWTSMSISPAGNCAHFHKGGWWYNACAHSNLNGVWYRGGHYRSKHQDGIFWAEYRGGSYSLKAVQMMIKPIDWRQSPQKWHRASLFGSPNVNTTCYLVQFIFTDTICKLNCTVTERIICENSSIFL